MADPDLNLLYTLEALLAEGSVTRAGRKLRLSPSAMSRALARLRRTTGDPLLVRAGRGLVPSPRALALRDRVGPLLEEVAAALRPERTLDLARLERVFTLRTRDGFVENFGPALLARLGTEAPGVRLRFVQKLDRDAAPLREGRVDLETGVVARATGPELRARALFRDRFVGAVRAGHPLSRGRVTAARYAAGRHIDGTRQGAGETPVDAALALRGLERAVVATVDGFATALALARASDLIATVPERHTGNLRTGMHSFPLPVETPALTVSLLWHPRQDADPAHRWLRDCVHGVCTAKSS
jgi:DNA-binding transcriptional LysR family regulator